MRVTPRVRRGSVSIVGAGPGDPGLLTLKALEALKRSDVVVYDRLVGRDILRLIPRRARRIPAESLGPHGAERQRGILRTLVEHAQQGATVVRLKGGDPFVFGRGGEEVEALAERGIPTAVIPGVTSAIAGPAAAGIPVSHRKLASVVTIATAHEARDQEAVPWERIGKVGGTVVVLMCTDRVGDVVRRLHAGGLTRSTPCAVVSRASLPDQEVRRATLGRIAELLRQDPVRSPALLVVGKVAAFADSSRRALPSTPARTRWRSVP